MIKPAAGVVSFIVLAIISVALFWREAVLLTLLIIFLGWLKHKLMPIKREGFWFAAAGLLGTTAESLMMYFGGNSWSYVQQTIFNFPLWLIPLWGLAGIIFITLYEGLFNRKR